ncbi:MAG: DNA polymerase/3'-5' exonuclease PolX [Calditrichaeota bacterium]|nr:MAG: DNA polymerase/3'-5' exonuclease PolX [Calditrichota bacterium]
MKSKLDKKQIAAILKEMAVLLEILGENPFKVRAHENAARVIEGLPNLEELVARDALISVKGIGEAMAKKVKTLMETGELPAHQRLLEKVPPGVLEMIKIPGVGPKKIRTLWQELNIISVDELEEACSKNLLAELKGFGKKTQENILRNIAQYRRFRERHLISDALQAARELVSALSTLSVIERCDIAGSLRRRKETVKDIDLVVSAAPEHRNDIMNFFVSLPEVDSITMKGETKSTVVLTSGISADLRIVSDDQYPFLLHHLTGSKEHNVALRQHALQLGLKISEYGLFKGEEMLPCNDEAELFQKLGMQYIPPELRENMGEIEAALAHRIPKLIELEDLLGIIHVHTNWSDGVNTIEEMARACMERGYQYLAISDHSQAATYANGLNEERIRQQHAEIDDLNTRLTPFRILKSIECDIMADGSLDFPDEILSLFDLVIVSVHSRFNMSEEEATQRIIRAMENPFVTILGHPTGRLLLARDGYPLNQSKVIEAAARLGVAIEINANPHRLDLDWRMCRYAIQKGVKLSINPDAHRIEGLKDVEYGVGIARKGWVEKKDVLNTWSAEEVLNFARNRHS